MILSIHQPAYLPWLGYFDKIVNSDIFIFLDNVQFEKNSFTNRNFIKSSNGPLLLTLPVLQKGHMNKKINEILINHQVQWKSKHLLSIEQNYKKSINFSKNIDKLIKIYELDDHFFSNFCYKILLFWMSEFKIKTKIIKASDTTICDTKSNLILNLCKEHAATKYISGPMGVDYLDLNSFKQNNIEVEFQSFKHPVYDQCYGDFIQKMSIIDYWMNNGSDNIFVNYKGN